MDRVTLDFETGKITWETDSQKGTEFDPDLQQKKAAILAAMGYETVDLAPFADAVNAFVNGRIGEDDFIDQMNKLSE